MKGHCIKFLADTTGNCQVHEKIWKDAETVSPEETKNT